MALVMDFRWDYTDDDYDYSGTGNTYTRVAYDNYTYTPGSVYVMTAPYYISNGIVTAFSVSTEDFTFEIGVTRCNYLAHTMCLLGDMITLKSDAASSGSVASNYYVNNSAALGTWKNGDYLTIKVQRIGGVYTLYINGVSQSAPTISVSFSSGASLRFGSATAAATQRPGISYDFLRFYKALPAVEATGSLRAVELGEVQAFAAGGSGSAATGSLRFVSLSAPAALGIGGASSSPSGEIRGIGLTPPEATTSSLIVRSGCTILSIAQAVCGRLGLQKPSTLVGNLDATASQLFSLLVEEVNDLSRRHAWQVLIAEASFTTSNVENQGNIDDLFPNMRFIINSTLWNRTLNRFIYGSLPPFAYQQYKASIQAGPWSQYRIFGNRLKFYPAPAAGQTIYGEYVRTVIGTDYTGADINDFTDDRDIPYLDCEAIRLGLLWRFKQQKGLDYAEDYAKYDRVVADLIARDGTKPVLNMGCGQEELIPGVFVPLTGWDL